MNAKFWVYANGGLVRLKLKPGQGHTWWRAWSHEEGWSSESITWSYPKGMMQIYRTNETDGTDCDGRLSTCTETYCPLDRLHAWPNQDRDGAALPAWERLSSRQRDYSAEAAGY
jgi:hypothetical protein